jgi:protein-disulfide isomerase
MIVAAVVVVAMSLLSLARKQPAAPVAPSNPVSLEGAALLGNPDARAVLLEFSDFQCPFCESFAVNVMPLIDEKYIKPGKLQIALRELPLPIHPLALMAARGAVCAGRQGRLWDMYGALFDDQTHLQPTDIRARARGIGLDEAMFNVCVADPSAAAAVEADVAEARKLKISSTPYLLLGERQASGSIRVRRVFAGGWSVADLQTAIEDVIGGER